MTNTERAFELLDDERYHAHGARSVERTCQKCGSVVMVLVDDEYQLHVWCERCFRHETEARGYER